MPSVFSSLFRFVRSSKKSALENFTTEALAVALRQDAGPFVRALLQDDVELASGTDAKAVIVETQVSVEKGIVDLVVELKSAAGRDLLWVEIKAHAGVSGNQLSAYSAAAEASPAELRPRVIMLCKRPIATVPTVRWNTLRRSIIDEGEAGYWAELRSFLEENGLADEYDTSITRGELDTAMAARSLMRKNSRIATEFLKMMRKEAPDGEWKACGFPTTPRLVESSIARQFQRHGRLMTFSKRYPLVGFGITFKGRPRLEVWVEFRPKDIDAREAVFTLAKKALSAETWAYDSPGYPSVRAIVDAEAHSGQEEALKWLRARFEELEQAGLFSELKKWRWKDREKAGEVGD